MPVPAYTFLLLSGVLFTMGAVGFLVRRNPLVVFMCIELMLNAVNLAFVAISRYLNSLDGSRSLRRRWWLASRSSCRSTAPAGQWM